MKHNLDALINKLETTRQQNVKWFYIYVAIGILGVIFFFGSIGFGVPGTPKALQLLGLPIMFAGLGLVGWGFSKSTSIRKLFMQTFRAELLKQLIAEAFPNTTYKQSYIAETYFESAQIGDKFSNYSGEDLIQTEINGAKIELCQIRTTISIGKHTRDCFGGEFAIIKPHTNLDINNQILLEYKNNTSNNDVVKPKAEKEFIENLPNETVKKYYFAYAQDATKAIEILSPSFLAWLEKNVLPPNLFKISIHIQPQAIYLAWHSPKDFLPISISQPVAQKNLNLLLEEIQRKFDLITELLTFFQPKTPQ